MHDPLLLPLGEFLDIFPYAVLCYLPFPDKLRVPWKKLGPLLFLIAAVQFIYNYTNNFIPYSLVKFTFLGWLIVYFLFYAATVKMPPTKLSFIFLLQTNYAGLIMGISNWLTMHIFPQYGFTSGYNVPLIHIHLCIFIITLPLILVLYKKLVPLLMLENCKTWNYLWIIPLCYAIALTVCVDKENLIQSWQYVIILITMPFCLYTTFLVVIKMFTETNENARLKENVRMINLLLIVEEETYKSLSDRIAETKVARHDIRHHLSVIEAYLQSNDQNGLLDYLKQYRSSLPKDTELILCENYAANAIVQHCMENANKEGISVSADLQLPQKIGILDCDLCIILGNCLENALEACRRMKGEHKYIHLKSELRGEMLGITVDNSFDGLVEEKNGMFFSHKREHQEGIGISSIRAVAAKYNGFANFTYEGKEFQVSVMLNTQAQES